MYNPYCLSFKIFIVQNKNKIYHGLGEQVPDTAHEAGPIALSISSSE